MPGGPAEQQKILPAVLKILRATPYCTLSFCKLKRTNILRRSLATWSFTYHIPAMGLGTASCLKTAFGQVFFSASRHFQPCARSSQTFLDCFPFHCLHSFHSPCNYLEVCYRAEEWSMWLLPRRKHLLQRPADLAGDALWFPRLGGLLSSGPMWPVWPVWPVCPQKSLIREALIPRERSFPFFGECNI